MVIKGSLARKGQATNSTRKNKVMPSCFALVRKNDPEKKRVMLQEVDNEMRQHFGAPVDADNWYRNWYNTVGMLLACGKSFAEIKDIYKDCDVKPIEWLEQNFDVESWYEHK